MNMNAGKVGFVAVITLMFAFSVFAENKMESLRSSDLDVVKERSGGSSNYVQTASKGKNRLDYTKYIRYIQINEGAAGPDEKKEAEQMLANLDNSNKPQNPPSSGSLSARERLGMSGYEWIRLKMKERQDL